MKYSRLTKEQFEEMHEEFINFLATQSITGEEWETIKKDKPEVAEAELDVFSDLVWEGVLNKVEYLEHYSKQQIFLFKIDQVQISLIGVKVNNNVIDITTPEGYQWLQENLKTDAVDIYTSNKVLKEDRNKDIFALIQQGSNITKGELYNYFNELLALD
ncbi:DUF6495 family protein [Croceibacter atlanticus]|jgi:hypothetical protein|uniref:Histidyl-tRNA synthetase n=1 Tax=Croceibacter atlanticus (strain ATCC BAA-628 / JCM 21780 / CIP 108009 / IAM 15332 / KCTC 12090 / HTCC2559) TaxID=216432 RepID=A3U971_CROAH|nr:DUF6495 family protein [Croceibacter atlanticus]EAP86357.1 hypothetical protein CA2559_09993 [Croceibacter atlanticus HTCC2559]MBW4971165.1 hypothetical protein [Croceibacter atlanticus]WSP34039.1 DUF6495 family protein [Croceibacter atlanticus]HAT70180.1 hypothetical protein [Flavobacteriaceae bacterium]|tara:strand:- start:59216 stop:59692 length:477 start_codon:yes stop_codon:yes gene_type:complete